MGREAELLRLKVFGTRAEGLVVMRTLKLSKAQARLLLACRLESSGTAPRPGGYPSAGRDARAYDRTAEVLTRLGLTRRAGWYGAVAELLPSPFSLDALKDLAKG